MFRSAFLLGVSFLALTACQPAAETADPLEAEAPPVLAQDGADAAATAAAIVEADDHDEHEDDHDDDHDEADDGQGGYVAHSEDEHDEEDHDDHGSGEAHVHGSSDLAISLDGATLSVSLDGALANFGLDETLRTLDDQAPYTDGIVALIGGDCTRDEASATIRPIGDHGNLTVDLTYTCASIETLTAIEVTGFETFAGFEEIKAVVFTDTDQMANTLTGSKTRLDLP